MCFERKPSDQKKSENQIITILKKGIVSLKEDYKVYGLQCEKCGYEYEDATMCSGLCKCCYSHKFKRINFK